MIRVMIVDDHEVVRIGLKSLLARVEDFEVVAEAGSADETVRKIDQLAQEGRAPDVVVMDVRMPGGSGVDACRQIRAKYPDIKVIMLTSYTDDEAIFASVMAGASGYVLKQVGSEDLIKAIRTVHAGGSLLDPSTTQRVLERMRQKDPLSDLPEPLDRAGAPVAQPHRGRQDQQRNRRHRLPQRKDGAQLRQQHPGQVRAVKPGGGGRLRRTPRAGRPLPGR